MRIDGPTPPTLPQSPVSAGQISGVSSFADTHLQAFGSELPVLPPSAVESGEQAGRTHQPAERLRRRSTAHREATNRNGQAGERELERQELESEEPEVAAGNQSYEDEAADGDVAGDAGDENCAGTTLDVML